LAHLFLFRFDRELGLDLRGLSPEVLEILQAYPWPGNVRELQGVIKRSMLNASGHLILPEFLPDQLHDSARPSSPPVVVPESFELASFIESRLSGPGGLYAEVIAAVERVLLTRVLRHTRGYQTRASELLGLSRPTLRHKLRSLGVMPDRLGPEDNHVDLRYGDGNHPNK
jgi:two-component system nitrogen regulation response regulator GlnG